MVRASTRDHQGTHRHKHTHTHTHTHTYTHTHTHTTIYSVRLDETIKALWERVNAENSSLGEDRAQAQILESAIYSGFIQ